MVALMGADERKLVVVSWGRATDIGKISETPLSGILSRKNGTSRQTRLPGGGAAPSTFD